MTQVLLYLGKLGGPISALLPAISSCTQQAPAFPGLSTEGWWSSTSLTGLLGNVFRSRACVKSSQHLISNNMHGYLPIMLEGRRGRGGEVGDGETFIKQSSVNIRPWGRWLSGVHVLTELYMAENYSISCLYVGPKLQDHQWMSETMDSTGAGYLVVVVVVVFFFLFANLTQIRATRREDS